MSTRANIIVSMENTKIILYRNYDGYPTSTGIDLVTKIQPASKTAQQIVVDLLTDEYDPGRQVYELTVGIHGDIEWAYYINVSRFGEITIGASQIHGCLDNESGVLRAQSSAAPISQFIADFLNPEIVKLNARMAEMALDPRYARLGLSMIDLLETA
jgi:hypothetical protein